LGRDLGDGVAPVDQQVPQGLRAAHVAREAATHAHDRDEPLFIWATGGFGPRRGAAASGHLRGQVAPALDPVLEPGGQGLHRGVVEGQGRGQRPPQIAGQEVAKLDCPQRVQALVAQRESRVDPGHLDAQQVRYVSVHHAAQVLERGAVGLGRGGFGDEDLQGAGQSGPQDPPVHGRQGDLALLSEPVVQGGQGGVRFQFGQALAQQMLAVGASHPLGPGAPVEGQGRQTAGPAVGGQGVQEGVGGRVVGLSGRSQKAPQGREEHEEVQVDCRLVQVPCSQFRGQDALQAVGILVGQLRVVQDSGRVDQAPHRGALGAQALQDLAHLRGVGHVQGQCAGGRPQVSDEGQVLFGGLVSAGQHRTGTLPHQPGRHLPTQGPQASGDQDAGVGDPGPRAGGRQDAAHQSGGVTPALSPGHLGLVVAGLELDQKGPGILVRGSGIEVDQSTIQFRVLLEDHSAQTPQGGLEGVAVLASHGPGTSADHPQGGRREASVPPTEGLDQADRLAQGPGQVVRAAGLQAVQAEHSGQVRGQQGRLPERVHVHRSAPALVQDLAD